MQNAARKDPKWSQFHHFFSSVYKQKQISLKVITVTWLKRNFDFGFGRGCFCCCWGWLADISACLGLFLFYSLVLFHFLCAIPCSYLFLFALVFLACHTSCRPHLLLLFSQTCVLFDVFMGLLPLTPTEINIIIHPNRVHWRVMYDGPCDTAICIPTTAAVPICCHQCYRLIVLLWAPLIISKIPPGVTRWSKGQQTEILTHVIPERHLVLFTKVSEWQHEDNTKKLQNRTLWNTRSD